MFNVYRLFKYTIYNYCYANETEHPWMKVGSQASDKPIDSAILIKMEQFREMNKMKKLSLKVTSNLSFCECIKIVFGFETFPV